jgi:Domain of unknown function (DUF4845)
MLGTRRQRGLTLTGMFFGSIALVIVLLLGFKVFPVYAEYHTIQKIFKALAEDPALRGAARRQVMTAYAARASVDNVQSITPDQIEVTKKAGGIVVSAQYEKRVPLFYNVSACFDFQPSSE